MYSTVPVQCAKYRSLLVAETIKNGPAAPECALGGCQMSAKQARLGWPCDKPMDLLVSHSVVAAAILTCPPRQLLAAMHLLYWHGPFVGLLMALYKN
jgi:hypothetical protein